MIARLFLLTFVLLQQGPVPLLHPVTTMPSFSVVSVRPVKPGEEGSHGSSNVDTYRAEHTTIKEVLAYAFGIGYDGEMVAGPAWVSNERFDV